MNSSKKLCKASPTIFGRFEPGYVQHFFFSGPLIHIIKYFHSTKMSYVGIDFIKKWNVHFLKKEDTQRNSLNPTEKQKSSFEMARAFVSFNDNLIKDVLKSIENTFRVSFGRYTEDEINIDDAIARLHSVSRIAKCYLGAYEEYKYHESGLLSYEEYRAHENRLLSYEEQLSREDKTKKRKAFHKKIKEIGEKTNVCFFGLAEKITRVMNLAFLYRVDYMGHSKSCDKLKEITFREKVVEEHFKGSIGEDKIEKTSFHNADKEITVRTNKELYLSDDNPCPNIFRSPYFAMNFSMVNFPETKELTLQLELPTFPINIEAGFPNLKQLYLFNTRLRWIPNNFAHKSLKLLEIRNRAVEIRTENNNIVQHRLILPKEDLELIKKNCPNLVSIFVEQYVRTNFPPREKEPYVQRHPFLYSCLPNSKIYTNYIRKEEAPKEIALRYDRFNPEKVYF